MTFCHTHRSIPCSAKVREASSCRWEQIQRSIARHYVESETSKHSASTWVSRTLWIRREKGCKRKTRWKPPSPSKSTRSMLIWTHRARSSMHRTCMCRSAPGPLCIRYAFWFCIFLGFLSVWVSGWASIFCAFSWVSPSVCLSCPSSNVFIFILLYFVIIL